MTIWECRNCLEIAIIPGYLTNKEVETYINTNLNYYSVYNHPAACCKCYRKMKLIKYSDTDCNPNWKWKLSFNINYYNNPDLYEEILLRIL